MDIKELQCIFYDFDGVMTDNRVIVDQDGKESVCVSRGDGYGVGIIRKLGIPQIIVSTEVNPVVERRGEKLNIPVIHGVSDKAVIVKKYCEENGYDPLKTMFMGNDLNDLPAFDIVGFTAAPHDAEPEVLERADWISSKNGGYGAVRELARYLSQE